MNGSLGAYRAAASRLDNLSPQARALADALIAAGVKPEEIISGFRSPQRNAAVGGAKRSQHLSGSAIDIGSASWPEARRAQVLQAAIANGARGIGLYPGGSMHFDTRQTPAFWGPSGYRGSGINTAPAWAQPHLAKMFGTPAPTGATQTAAAQTATPRLQTPAGVNVQASATPQVATPGPATPQAPASAPAPLLGAGAQPDAFLLSQAAAVPDPMAALGQRQDQARREMAMRERARREALFGGSDLAGLYA